MDSVASRTATKPRLLVFYRRSEGASRVIDAHLAQVLQARKNHETFVVHRVEVSERPDLDARLKVETLPSLVVVDDKRVTGKLEQPRGSKDIKEFLKPWLR